MTIVRKLSERSPVPAAAVDKHVAVLGPAPAVVRASTTDLAYAAGLLDGEGFITIASRSAAGARGLCYTMRVGISQNETAPLFWLRDRWGGSVNATARKTARHNTTHAWICCARQALRFLLDVQPYLIVKAERAAVAIEFQRALFNPGVRGHSAEYREACARFKERINAMNTHKPIAQSAHV